MDISAVKTILKREFSSYFSTPVAIIFLTVFLMLNGFFTFKLGGFYEIGQADLRTFFVWHPWLYLFIVPAVSMRLWAEERKSGTIELLLTYPISIFDAFLGKFLAGWLFIGVALLLTFPIVLTVCYLGKPDLGVIIASYIGSFLMAGAFLAIGCGVSAVSDSQVIAYVISTIVILFFILLGFDPMIAFFSDYLPVYAVQMISSLSIPFHFEGIQRGILQFTDIVYFFTIIFFSLASGVLILERVKSE